VSAAHEGVPSAPLTARNGLSEAQRIAAVIAETSAELSGGSETKIATVIIERFAANGLQLSRVEAGRIAHDIASAPKHRDEDGD
jgi:hypothetical protein